MTSVTYNKTVSCPVSKLFVEKVVVRTSRYEKKVTGNIELTIVGDREIRRLNREWRGKDAITDVLSFAWNESGGEGNVLAQIYICFAQIKRQAKDFKVSVKEEFTRMLVHGLLHSVGYDHVTKPQAKRMFALQEKIVTEILYD